MQQNTEAQMADLLEWRQRLESTHKQLLDAMTELITNKNYSEAERILYVVDTRAARTRRLRNSLMVRHAGQRTHRNQ
jgi:hypothetical protein